MKRLLPLLALTAILAGCGSGGGTTHNTTIYVQQPPANTGIPQSAFPDDNGICPNGEPADPMGFC